MNPYTPAVACCSPNKINDLQKPPTVACCALLYFTVKVVPKWCHYTERFSVEDDASCCTSTRPSLAVLSVGWIVSLGSRMSSPSPPVRRASWRCTANGCMEWTCRCFGHQLLVCLKRQPPLARALARRCGRVFSRLITREISQRWLVLFVTLFPAHGHRA